MPQIIALSSQVVCGRCVCMLLRNKILSRCLHGGSAETVSTVQCIAEHAPKSQQSERDEPVSTLQGARRSMLLWGNEPASSHRGARLQVGILAVAGLLQRLLRPTQSRQVCRGRICILSVSSALLIGLSELSATSMLDCGIVRVNIIVECPTYC